MEWVDCNLGSKLTMKYPSIYLLGERAHGEILSIAFAGKGQHQDAGGKIIHAAPKTTSSIFSKSISKDGGRATYRGLLEVAKGATEAKSKVVCDALLLDEESRSDTYPTIRIDESDANVGHEASVSKVGEEQLFYLQTPRPRRGGGVEDDRQRLHRADRQGAADGVRGRDEPPDRAADGRLDWLARPRGAAAPSAIEPDWLSEARDRAKELGAGLELPTQKQKGWEFTDLAGSTSTATPSAVATVEGLEPSSTATVARSVMPLAEAAADASPSWSRERLGRDRPGQTTRSPRATRRAGATACSSTCPRTRGSSSRSS